MFKILEFSCKKDQDSLIEIEKFGQKITITVAEFLTFCSFEDYLKLREWVDLDTASLKERAWINIFGSGTLKYSVQAKSAYKTLYYHERAALEIGPEWDFYQESRVNCGKPIAIEDCPAWTESLWQWKRYSTQFQVTSPKWLIVDDDNRWEGLGLRMKVNPDFEWLPKSKVLIAKLFQWKNQEFVRE